MNKSLVVAIILCTSFSLINAQSTLVEAESFTDKGGWVVDQQFTEQMGSPYLLAHGMGVPVKDASTHIRIQETGKYHVWARTKNWVPGNWEAPGRFYIHINGRRLENQLGKNPGWNWEYAGELKLQRGKVKLSLQDFGWFDADKMDKILFNLLSNAFKYTPRGGTINLTIQAATKDDLQFVKIFVNDTGSGIEASRVPHIFDRFFGNNQHGDSNGIGLSLTKDLVEIHKGIINVESQVNVGTTFVVELPIDKEFYNTIDFKQNATTAQEPQYTEDSTVNEPLINANASPVKDKSITLLIVEDNVDLLMIIASTLSRYYTVITAENGVQAMEKLQENEVDIIISDVMMPEMDGLTFCRTLKENVDHSHTSVLLLTAKNQVEDRIACYNAGADAYIAKPFEMDVLIARIHSLIINRQKRNTEFRSSLSINPKNYESNSIDANFLKDAINVVEENLSNFDFTHDDLFDALHTSKSTLYRKIKSLTGFSPSEFIRNIRLKHACLMLKNGTGNISEIAYDVGFNDPKYFSTCFKNEFGMTPREYMRDNKPEDPTLSDT